MTCCVVSRNRFAARMAVAVTAALLATFAGAAYAAEETPAVDSSDDRALADPLVIMDPGPEYGGDTRPFQGIPGLERAPGGRLWATWYGGGETEGPENYCMLVTSGDDGATWSGLKMVVDTPGDVRTFDPCLWLDPTGRLWFFWAQGYSHWDGRSGVWAVTTTEPDAENPAWSAPRRLCDGIMMNKPTVLSTGEWLLPVAIWAMPPNVMDPSYAHDITENTGSNVFRSTDAGATWESIGRSRVEGRRCDEHMLVERRDGSLWKLVRTNYGIGESVSTDRGVTWTEGVPSESFTHIPSARFFIRRLASGNLLLVKHSPPNNKTRSHLMAYLSDDDGKSWKGGLMLDDRGGVSYPDGFQAPGGSIYIVYDFERRRARQILMAVFTEEDILACAPTSAATRLRVLINQAQ